MDAPSIILRSFRFLERLPRFRARKIQANVSVWIVGKMRKLVVDAPISSWEGEYPPPPRPLLLIPCGLAAVEGRPVNEEITINRFLSSLPQSSHGRVWNPTMIPAVLTRPILSQIIMNYLVKLYFILSVYNLLRSGGKTLDTSSTIHGVQNCLGEMKCQT